MACEDAISKGQRAGRKKRFFVGMPAKGLGVSGEITRQQVQSKQGGTPFSPAPCVGVAWLCTHGCSACQGQNGHTKGLQKDMDEKPLWRYY